MTGERARIKDHIARGNMTEIEAQEWAKKGFKDRNMYITIPKKPVSAVNYSDPEDNENTRSGSFDQ